MSIQFNESDWKRISETYRKWWNGELERPLFNVWITGCDPGREEPRIARRHRTAQYPDEVSAEEIVDRWDYELSCRRYPGDSFPVVWPDFGPGALAAFLGARPHVDDNTVWFHAPGEIEIQDLHFRYNEQHPWVKRIDSIIQAANRRWGGNVLISTTDLGGTLDVLQSFRPGEGLLLDLYDQPDEVKRVTNEIHEAWWKYFWHFAEVAQTGKVNRGYSAWTVIYSEDPYYMLQCDFAYTISPAMFDEFVKPELARSCQKLKNAFYHLDGVGQLPHLDSLMSIEELRGVQWIPGDGKPKVTEWPDVMRKIHSAGKLIQFYAHQAGGIESIDRMVEQLGTGKGVLMIGAVPREQEDKLMRLLEKYGAA